MATLLLIRHGQASYGQADYDRLSARGELQAAALGTYLANQRVDALYVGPLRRQVQTAALAAETARTLPAQTTIAELAEYPAFEMIEHFMPKLVAEDPEFAALPGKPTRALADRAFKTILDRWSRDEWQLDGVERVTSFAARGVRAGLDRVIRDAGSGARIAVITSAGPIGVALGLVFGATEHHMVRASVVVRNASISELKLRTKDFALASRARVADDVQLLVGHLPSELHTEY